MNKAITILALAFGFLLGVIAGPWLWPPELLKAFSSETAEPQQAEILPAATPPPPPPPATPPASEPELALKGVFVGGDASRALIAYGDETPRPYKQDDKLPDGSVLKAINSKDVEIEKNGETRTLLIERGTPTAEAPEEAEEVTEVPEEPEAVEEPPPVETAEEEPVEEAVPEPPSDDATAETEATAEEETATSP